MLKLQLHISYIAEVSRRKQEARVLGQYSKYTTLKPMDRFLGVSSFIDQPPTMGPECVSAMAPEV